MDEADIQDEFFNFVLNQRPTYVITGRRPVKATLVGNKKKSPGPISKKGVAKSLGPCLSR